MIMKDAEDDDQQSYRFSHPKTWGELAVVTTDELDESAAEACSEAQDELADTYEDHGTVTRTQGTAHSENAHTCGVVAKNSGGLTVEFTLFVAKGAKASFMTISSFPTTLPTGASQEDLDQATREASMMSSKLLDNID